MKKSLLTTLPVAAFVAGMAVVPSVFADTLPSKCNTDVINYDTFKTALDADECTTITLNGNVDAGTVLITIPKSLVLDLNGNKISRTNPAGNTVINITSGEVTIQDSSEEQDGTIEYIGTSSAGPTRAVTVDSNSTLTVNGGIFIGQDGIGLWGTSPTLNFAGGKIMANDGNGITGNGKYTTNATVKVTNGIIESTGGAAIYQPESGTLTISGGSLSGVVGVVVRGSETTIDGGKITAKGSGTVQIGDADVELPSGTAVIVDNEQGGYPDSASAEISGNVVIDAEAKEPVLAYGVENNEGDTVTVGKGVTFTGTTPSSVYLEEGLTVAQNGVVMTEAEAEKLAEELANQNKPATEEVANPNTADPIALYATIAVLAVLGLGATAVAAKKSNR